MLLTVGKCPRPQLAQLLRVFMNSNLYDENREFVIIDTVIYKCCYLDIIPEGCICLNNHIRMYHKFALNDKIQIEYLNVGSDAFQQLEEIVLFVSSNNKKFRFNKKAIRAWCMVALDGAFLDPGQSFTLKSGSGANYTIRNVKSIPKNEAGLVTKNTKLVITNEDGYSLGITQDAFKFPVTANKTPEELYQAIDEVPVFEVEWDFKRMGIGGMGSELNALYRRAFMSRTFPREHIRKLGIKHACGVILYGPPGTGKTLIARQIGKMLSGTEPTIVNGPEILSKYVGDSENNMRKLFEPSEREWKSKKHNSSLHVIIFDEIDSLCRKRGSGGSSSSGVGDRIVNQLLTKMDGVSECNNFLIIGMTNRLELLDEALLRPGRFEVHIPIGMPNEQGRLEILNIHTKCMRKNKSLEEDVDLESIASSTQNYTGAELAGVVRSAASFSLSRHTTGEEFKVDMDNLPDNILVSQDDFELALSECKPHLGMANVNENVTEWGIIPYNDSFVGLQEELHDLVENQQSCLLPILLHGIEGCGKTSLSLWLAKKCSRPHTRLIDSSKFIDISSHDRPKRLLEMYNESITSTCIIILDDIEDLVEWSPIGYQYNNGMITALKTILRTPPSGDKKCMLLVTTCNIDFIRKLGLDCKFVIREIPKVEKEDHPIILEAISMGENEDSTDDGTEDGTVYSTGIKTLIQTFLTR